LQNGRNTATERTARLVCVSAFDGGDFERTNDDSAFRLLSGAHRAEERFAFFRYIYIYIYIYDWFRERGKVQTTRASRKRAGCSNWMSLVNMFIHTAGSKRKHSAFEASLVEATAGSRDDGDDTNTQKALAETLARISGRVQRTMSLCAVVPDIGNMYD